jgi:hypothetical protein
MSLAGMLGGRPRTRPDIASYLDSIDATSRSADCLTLSKDNLKRLWEVASADPGEAQDLVGGPAAAIFAGLNSLRLMRRFEKHFVGQDGQVIGYNRHRLGWLIGPGYFVVSETPKGLLFDYSRVPGNAPAGWPHVAANSRLFAAPVYGRLQDDAVWVAHGVLIGSARRGDSSLDSHFVLVRQ